MNVLLLHGQPGGAHDWDSVRAAIGSRAVTHAIDRPGYDGVSEPGGLEHSADMAVRWMDSHGVATATVAGLSFGGGVAAWIAAKYPHRVDGLVLISAAASRESLQRSDRVLAAPLVGQLASTALVGGIGALLRSRRLQQSLERRHDLPRGYLAAAGRRMRTRAALTAFVVEQRAMFAELPRLERMLPAISAPTTVVLGTADTVVPPAASRNLAAAIPGAELVEITGGRHTLPVTHPQRIGATVLAAGLAADKRRADQGRTGGLHRADAGDADGIAGSDDRLHGTADDRR